MSPTATLALLPEMFGPSEREVLRFGAFGVRTFRYPSGVAALRIANGAGEVVALPFRGQQVWDATFLGRRLTMGSPFDTPRDTDDYLGSYGAFLLHCGLAAMGNPGPGDDHPLHGELPVATLDEAWLAAGEDAEGPFLELGGRTRQARAFFHRYEAVLSLRLREGATVMEVGVDVANRAARPLPLMYLAHANFRPAEGGEILDTVPDAELLLRPRPDDDALPEGTVRHGVLAHLPSHRRLPPGARVDPELVFRTRPVADAEGWAHALQLHPDGSADLVSHRPVELPASVRWIVRDGDMDAMGFSLPATGAPDGLAVAKARGETVIVPPGGTWRATVRVGAVPPPEAARLRARIEAVRAGFA